MGHVFSDKNAFTATELYLDASDSRSSWRLALECGLIPL